MPRHVYQTPEGHYIVKEMTEEYSPSRHYLTFTTPFAAEKDMLIERAVEGEDVKEHVEKLIRSQYAPVYSSVYDHRTHRSHKAASPEGALTLLESLVEKEVKGFDRDLKRVRKLRGSEGRA